MKKLELSEMTSNLLVLSSVLLALSPLLLGEKLPLMVATALREGPIAIQDFFGYLIGFLG
jgi:hypothetical protein